MSADPVFTLRLDCANAAFAEQPEHEVARILRKLAEHLEQGEDFSKYRTLLDVNGNDVGRARLA